MWQQNSFQNEDIKGCLYLVPTPIGNLEDMTYRAIRILKESDIIAAEDTRQTKKLLNYFQISNAVMSYHEHNKDTSGEKIINLLKSGKKVALVSDAGMPTISDPGFEIVVAALKEQYKVIPLPGANAALTSLIASGIKTQPFYFYGFLPRHKKEKRKQLELCNQVQETMIFYESPHRLQETLKIMLEQLGDRPAVLSRELTKKYEEFIRGTIQDLFQWSQQSNVRGEFCIIVEGSSKESQMENQWWEELTVVEHIDYYINKQSYTSKDAIKKVAKDRDMVKREVYQQYHIR
ncbi:16S rRNA (cytidine(1402)-2'-O)-methyltransferase [Cytobacillus sp. IB215665]|uniref:16S rRNA (cytidine(1402)-2'-O)-methyltransferase n=1 Tax=Cytobacillus sp. IB215665 TaxID=3097357 RepID=UPI002A158138|nr:16S rRNA (cytidine(1402)-2'-O)-methyltransferase [Cytobacillus sp. IB215665]MDX8367612.1 16S rRNA (cytidine(1402)-2'-O)-methyltransferase [Cytobacillus sp. IB215665]